MYHLIGMMPALCTIPDRYLYRPEGTDDPTASQVTKPKDPETGVTQAEQLAAIANFMAVQAIALKQARTELQIPFDTNPERRRFPCVAAVNGYLASALIGMLSVSDQIAVYCNKYYVSDTPDCVDNETVDAIYFVDYNFSDASVVNFISPIQRRLEEVKFKGMKFSKLANKAKHHLSWFGMVIAHPRDETHDIIIDGVGLLRDVAVPVYKELYKVLGRLGSMVKTPVTLPQV
jgi:hypothetical protein